MTDLRIRQNREFFNVAPQIALDIFYDIAKMIEDAVVTVYKDNKPITYNEKPDGQTDEHKRIVRRGRFKFSMVGIKIGECITFIPTNTEVKVAGDDSIEYEGRIYKLSPFVGTFMPEDKRNTSGAYQGAKYFSYKGKILDDLRSEMENEETFRNGRRCICLGRIGCDTGIHGISRIGLSLPYGSLCGSVGSM